MNSSVNQGLGSISIIPQPVKVNRGEGFFALNADICIEVDSGETQLKWVGGYLSDCLGEDTGLVLRVGETSQKSTANVIGISLYETDSSLGDEGYRLSVTSDLVHLSANHSQGVFYGIQTLRQLIANDERGETQIPCVEIWDRPRFHWRGLHLDCARHFMTKEYIKRLIDVIAFHKLNILHLHLTDDQGWRIEIERFPKLIETGAWRGQGSERYGGYYPQDDLKEIVAYAKERFIDIVPEFDVPGHTSAAIASYPELSCLGEPIPVKTEWGIFEDVLCPGKEKTFEFIEGVLDEIIDLFPFPFIHIGGDESPRARWEACPDCQRRIRDEGLNNEHELQSYLIQRVVRFLSERGRRVIGWDEILHGGRLTQGMVVQFWQGMDGAAMVTENGMDIIASPLQFVYFDYPQTEDQVKTKPDWMRLTTLETAYAFNPIPDGFSPEQAKRVLGGECALWTEYAPYPHSDAQLFPRLCAFSETVWSLENGRNWIDFSQRMKPLLAHLDRMSVLYFKE